MEIVTSPWPPAPSRWSRLLAVLGVFAPVTLLALLPIGLGLERYVVTGDEMAPAIERGSVLLERDVPVSDLRVGDVITFAPPPSTGRPGPVTRRIVAIEAGRACTPGPTPAPSPGPVDAGPGPPHPGAVVVVVPVRRLRLPRPRRPPAGRPWWSRRWSGSWAVALPVALRPGAAQVTRMTAPGDIRVDGAVAGPMLPPMAQRVLVVEDEEDIAFPLVRTLEREGYDVTWVDSGQKALDSLAAGPPDVVILDLGPARHRRARGLPAGPRRRLRRARS